MPDFNIVKVSEIPKSFRTESIKGQFDLNIDKVEEKFEGNIDLNDKTWNIGIIYGASGTGKSTIAKQLFPKEYFIGHKYTKNPVVDDMPEDISTEEITKAFNSVGFGTVWSWLKPYSVLSTGEKMRVDLAKLLLEKNELIVFDEFTSVVNREVAKIGSYAIQKAIRKQKKKFIAVSCHDDIIDWLEPDWTFCADDMSFKFGRCHRRPKIELEIKKIGRGYWNIFKKYHYLNHNINHSAQCFCAFYKNRPIAFNAVLHTPNRYAKNLKRSSRLVVLPDYQGIGAGHILSNIIAQYYKDKGFRFIAVNSNKILANARAKDKKWILKNKSRKMSMVYPSGQKCLSRDRITYSYEFIG